MFLIVFYYILEMECNRKRDKHYTTYAQVQKAHENGDNNNCHINST